MLADRKHQPNAGTYTTACRRQSSCRLDRRQLGSPQTGTKRNEFEGTRSARTQRTKPGAMAVAGRAAEAASTWAQNQPIVLELPPGRRFVNLKLQWSSGEGALALVSSRASQLPEIDMAIFSRRWHVWLPPRFGLSNSELDGQIVACFAAQLESTPFWPSRETCRPPGFQSDRRPANDCRRRDGRRSR